MNRYLLESPRTDDECLPALDLVVATGHITHYDWCCETGERTGSVIIEAENESERCYPSQPLSVIKPGQFNLINSHPK